MQQTKGSTSRTSAVGYGCDKHARPFTYGWKRLARTSGMQQHTEHRSVRSCSKLSVMTRAVLERPPPASFARQRPAVRRCSNAHRQRALLQESLLESAPSQTNTEGRLTTVSLCFVLFPVQLVLLVISVLAICYLLHLQCYSLTSALYVYSWGLLIPTGFVQFCQHYAGSWYAVHPICTEGGEQSADLDTWQQASKRSIRVDAKMLYLFLSSIVLLLPGGHELAVTLCYVQGGWATLGVLGLLWGCTNYTGKVSNSFSSITITITNNLH